MICNPVFKNVLTYFSFADLQSAASNNAVNGYGDYKSPRV